MKLKDAVVLVTGANRGIGLEFARQALELGAKKIYAAARNPLNIPLDGVEKVRLDVTNTGDIADLSENIADLTLLINNAGIAQFGGFMNADSIDSCRRHLETNFFGPLMLSKACAPILAANGGGAILNVLSVACWLNSPMLGAYAMSKSAAWALTNGLRLELAAQHTQVTALHMGFVDTDMSSEVDMPKSSPEEVVARALNGLEQGKEEILADELSAQVKQGLTMDPPVYLKKN